MSIWDYLSKADTLISLFTALFGSLLTWLIQEMRNRSKRNRRLREITQAAQADEIAVCIRIGGGGDPLPDVRKYLQAQHPAIKQILLYNVSAGDAESQGGRLDSAETAMKIIEDINEGLRAYGQGTIARVHFFPAGMIAYAPTLLTMMSNWGKVIVYHKPADGYTPLYVVDKDRRHSERREFDSLKNWEVASTLTAASPDSVNQLPEKQQQGASLLSSSPTNKESLKSVERRLDKV